jgi:hypothetical protein
LVVPIQKSIRIALLAVGSEREKEFEWETLLFRIKGKADDEEEKKKMKAVVVAP